MSSGKLSAQTGHAFTETLCAAQETHPEEHRLYLNKETGGSKVVLEAKSADHLIRAYNQALAAGLPCSIVVDKDHIMPPYFLGQPIITALGIGPCTKAQCRHIVKRFKCVK